MDARRPYDIESLTDVAFAVFAARGYDAASMDDVARTAGITKAAIYHHVAGKEALLERGLARALDALFAILDDPAAADAPPDARLRAIVERVAATTIRLLPEVSVLFRVRGNSAVERRAMDRRRAFDAAVGRLVRAAQDAGRLRGDLDAGLIVRLAFGMSNSVVEWYRPGGREGAGAIAAAVVAILFDGLGAGVPTPRVDPDGAAR